LTINKRNVYDFFGVMYEMEKDEMAFVIKTDNSSKINIIVKRDNYKNILCEFEDQEMLRCRNKCIFCFIDQNPRSLRKELYIKDDDYRESLKYGNFITLSNMPKTLLYNIVEHKLSPLYVSLHSVEDDLRKKIFGRENTIKKIQYLLNEKIKMHCQIVLMKGINDGKHLMKTFRFAKENRVYSLGIVPVGITKFRQKLYTFEEFNKEYAKGLIDSVEEWKRKNSYFKIYLADEFFLMAELPVPAKQYYGKYPQIENGIGMVRLFEEEVKNFRGRELKKDFAILTGRLFREYLLRTNCFNGERIYPVSNSFLGRKITVTGLISGKDIILCLKKVRESDIIIYRTVFNYDKITLDNYTKKDIERMSGKRIRVIDKFKEIQEYLE